MGTDGLSAEYRQESGRVWVLRVAGEIDLASAPELRSMLAQVAESRPSKVMLELEDVAFLDSSGIRVLVLAKRDFDALGVPFVIDGMSGAVQQVLEISGLLNSLTALDD